MRTHSAGTSEIARQSGGDSMPVTGASALEDTLARLRQRYALNFYLPGDVKAGQQRHIDVQLASAALRRYPDAEVRFRHTYYVPDGVTPGPASVAGSDSGNSDPVVVTRAGSTGQDGSAEPATPMTSGNGGLRRRRAVNEDGSSVDAPAASGTDTNSGTTITRPDPTTAQPSRGWRRVDEPTRTPGPIVDKTTDDKKTDKKPPDTKDQDSGQAGWPKAK